MKRKAPLAVLEGFSSPCGDEKEEKARLGKRSSKKAAAGAATNTSSSSHLKKKKRAYGSRGIAGATTTPRSFTKTTATLQKPSQPSSPPRKACVQGDSISGSSESSTFFGPAPRQSLNSLTQPSLPLPPRLPVGDDTNTTSTRHAYSTTDTTEMTSNVKTRLPEQTTQNWASMASATTVTEAARLLGAASTSNNNNPLKRNHSGNLPRTSSSKDASSDANSVKFRVDETRPFLGLVEGVQVTTSPTLKTDYLESVLSGRQAIPRLGRMMELPSSAMLGTWTAHLMDTQDSSCSDVSNATLTGSRLSLRHESYSGIGGLQPSITSSQSSSTGAPPPPPPPQDTSNNLTVSCIHPSHNRIPSMQCQGILNTHIHTHSFLGSLSLIAFDGFTSTSDMNTRAQEVSRVLERAKVPADYNSKPHKQSSLLLKIPNFGVSMLCSLPFDSNYILWIGQDPNLADNAIVAVDVIFGSDPASETLSLLASEDPFQLTEQRLHSHTSSVVETRYDPFQRLWGKCTNNESNPSNIHNHHKPPPQDDCTFTKPGCVLLPQAKQSAISSRANELASKFHKTKAQGDLPLQQQQLRPSPKKKSRRTLALGATSNKKSEALGISNEKNSALAPFPSVTPTPRPTTTTTTSTKPVPHHMKPTNFLERFDKAQNTASKKEEALLPVLTDPPVVQRIGSPFQLPPPSRVVDDGDTIPFDDDNDAEWPYLRPRPTTKKAQKTVVKPRRLLTKVSKRETIVRESLDTSDTWDSGALHARLELESPPSQPHDIVVVPLFEKENKIQSLKNAVITRRHGVTKPNWRSVVYLLASLIPMDGQGPPPSVVPTRTVSGIGASKFHQQHYYPDLPIVDLEEEWNAGLNSHLQLQPQPGMETVETSADIIAEEDASRNRLGWLGGSWL